MILTPKPGVDVTPRSKSDPRLLSCCCFGKRIPRQYLQGLLYHVWSLGWCTLMMQGLHHRTSYITMNLKRGRLVVGNWAHSQTRGTRGPHWLYLEIGVLGLPGPTLWTCTLSRHKAVLLPGRDTMLHKWVLGLFAHYLGSTDRSFLGLKMRFTTLGVISKYYHYEIWKFRSPGYRTVGSTWHIYFGNVCENMIRNYIIFFL